MRYVTLETFTNDFINSLRDDSIEGFKNRYRTVDVLLIDDIQFLQKKEQTQEEFFHTFNTLYDAQKQIVLTSDRHPKGLATLEDRLVSRFEWGLITDIQPPDLETRVAILRKKVRTDRIVLADDDILMLIASRVPTNIRELEGCLTRVVAYSSITKRPIDVDLAREVLKDIPETAATRVTIDLILSAVADSTGVSVTEIIGDKRSRPVVESRHLAMYLARELTDSSLPKIGERFGNRDHTTVLHAVEKITKLMREDREMYNRVQRLTTKIKSALMDRRSFVHTALSITAGQTVHRRGLSIASSARLRRSHSLTPLLVHSLLPRRPRRHPPRAIVLSDRLSTPSTVSTNPAIFLY